VQHCNSTTATEDAISNALQRLRGLEHRRQRLRRQLLRGLEHRQQRLRGLEHRQPLWAIMAFEDSGEEWEGVHEVFAEYLQQTTVT